MKKVGLVGLSLAGNLLSIEKSVSRFGWTPVLIESPKDLDHIEKLIIPGVGTFAEAMATLHQKNVVQAIRTFAETKPVMGICLGMQLLASLGFEYGVTEGLNLIDAEVKKVECRDKLPHLGFNKIQQTTSTCPLFKGVQPQDDFYFMHSYEMVNYRDVAALTQYGGHTFVSAVHKQHVFGVQFHPEKSREPGQTIFRNFLEL